VQLAADLTGRPLSELRVLDLGALEGQYAVEFALHGAEVMAIEGREANAAKARLAAEVLGLDNLEIRQEDVRGLSAERHGSFDVVLCLGLLYHLDRNDLFPFLDQLAEVCTSLLILDTHVGYARGTTTATGAMTPRVTFVEHSPEARPSSASGRFGPRSTTRNSAPRLPERAQPGIHPGAREGFRRRRCCDRLTFAAGHCGQLRSPPPPTSGPRAGSGAIRPR
jgi:SAM-dependent methyltransferase